VSLVVADIALMIDGVDGGSLGASDDREQVELLRSVMRETLADEITNPAVSVDTGERGKAKAQQSNGIF
jgi:hypothetical protein